MNSRIIIALVSLILVFNPLICKGQKIRLYKSEQGLSNSLIHRVFQDKRGYIWIATDNGVSYFDGMRFFNFHHDPQKKGTLSSDMVRNVFTDSRGTCWVGTSNGLQIFDYKINVFRDFPLQYPFYTKTYFVSSITESPDNKKLLVTVPGVGIAVYDALTHKIDRKTTDRYKEIFGSKYLGFMMFDSEGYLWTFDELGNFCRFDYKQNTIRKDLWVPELYKLSKEIAVSAIVEDPVTRNFLIGTYNHGLFIYDRTLGYVRRTKGKSSSGYKIRALLAEKKDGQISKPAIWIGTEESGLKKFDRNTEEITNTNIQYSPVDLNNCKVHSLLQDNQGNIWAGIFQKGLLIIPKSTYNFEYLKLSENPAIMNENSACATSIIRDLKENLWIGTDGGGLFRFSKSGDITRYTSQNSVLPNNFILSLNIDKRGTLWISTNMGGITTYNPNIGFRSYSNELELQKVNCSFYDNINDKLYLGTLGFGVKVLSIKENTIHYLPKSKNYGWINSLYIDKSNILWVGRSKGIRCYDTQTGIEKYLELAKKTSDSRINTFLDNLDGTLWIATENGLYLYNKRNDSILSYTLNEGLPNNMVQAIQKDGNGMLWLSTGKGLSCFDPKQIVFKNYYSFDGLQDNEFWPGATFKDKDGKMFFGGINGITAFYPQNVKSLNQPIPNIYFSQLSVLNRIINFEEVQGKNNILDRHISQAQQITLKKNQNVFSLEFAVLEYTNPKKVIYGYMLKGFDNDWRYTDSDHRLATYTNLPDGRYKFRVKAFFEGNTRYENVVYNEINLRILPPWYKTWWAYLIYLAILLTIVRELINLRKRKKIRIQERNELEKKEMKLRMFTNISHEIRTPLTLVINPLKSIREKETEPKRKDLYNLMYRNCLRILRMMNQLMDMRKFDDNKLRMHFNQTDLIYFIQDIMKSFEQLVIIRNIDFRLVSNREYLEGWIDQDNLDKVLFNILSNAFKFTPDNGYVLITIDMFKNNKTSGLPVNISEYIEIQIENSGSVIHEGDLERIFDRFYQSSGSNSGGSGIGLHLAKLIVQLHHGLIIAKNIENGVAFIIRIPLGKEHLSIEELSASSKHKDLYSSIRSDEKLPEQSEYIEILESEDNVSAIKESKSKKTIVFVDDDIDLGKYIRSELSNKYNVEIFPNSKEAWKAISTIIPDAIITDLIMPDVDGISLCKKIRQKQETNDLPVIILTSETDEESERKCIESGADSYLTKPISLELLKSTISQAIQTRDVIHNKYRSNIKLNFNEIQMSSPDSRLIANVIDRIRKNIENPEYSVDDLSREVGLSRVHLNRKLKENINISPSNLIKSIRLKQAAYLLIKNKVNVSEVAYKVGFSSPSYFTNNFHDYFGMTPSEFVLKFIDSDDKETLSKLFES